jgi:hypothetical protein
MATSATLHIEHPISDLETWLGAFTRFEDAREKAGVRAQSIHQPIDDDKYIYVRLDFDNVEEAKAFKRRGGRQRTPRRLSPALQRPGSSPR